jgi:glycerol-3-phosphate dehydrogenase
MFSATKRSEVFKQLSSQEYDLLVIGGGITGAGIALDGISRGLSVALIDMQDFAAGTSSRSTKLIHGGLRYLKQFEFDLVKEVGKEREIVYKNARHLVVPEKMMLPLVKEGTMGYLPASVGIYVYDWLAGVKMTERRKMLGKVETLKREPLLKEEILSGSAVYTEYRTDDARLVIEVMKTAVEKGAVCLNYVAAKSFTYHEGKIESVMVEDALSGQKAELKSKKIVNAAGPWVDKLRKKDDSLKGKRLHHTKGVHLVVAHDKLPVKHAMYFDVGDGRMIFAIPRDGITYIGTTDTDYTEQLERPKVSHNDAAYLLTAVNQLFDIEPLQKNDIISTWAGLRPLIHEDGKSPSELSRKDEMFISESGLISIAGGKLTGYRKMAERVVDKVMDQLDRESVVMFKSCHTDTIQVSGGAFASRKAMIEYMDNMIDEAKQVSDKPEKVKFLVKLYGSNAEQIIQKAYEIFPTIDDKEKVLDHAEAWYTIHHEIANNLCDFLIRRTGRLYFRRPQIAGDLATFADAFAQQLAWSDTEKQNQLDTFNKEYEEVLNFQ